MTALIVGSCVLSPIANADRNFQIRKQLTAKGSIEAIGNTQMSCSTGDLGAASNVASSTGGYDAKNDGVAHAIGGLDGAAPTDDQDVDNNDADNAVGASDCTTSLASNLSGLPRYQNNHFFYMHFLDVDTAAVAANGAPVTNSTTADLALPSGATVKAAYLYWAAWMSSADATAKGRSRSTVLFKTPATAQYQVVSATTTDEVNITANGFQGAASSLCDGRTGDGLGTGVATKGTYPVYQSVADVTTLVAAAGNGTYKVGNIAGMDARDSEGTTASGYSEHTNCYAGWTLVVMYEDTANISQFRSLTLFDGLIEVGQNVTKTTTVSGFQTPNSGAYDTLAGFIVYEGDGRVPNDNTALANITQLNNDANPINNIWNSSNTRQTIGQTGTAATAFATRSPSDVNMFGFDIDTFNIPTPATNIGNGVTQFDISFTTSLDVYQPGAFFLVLPTETANLEIAKSVTPSNAAIGETVTFSVTVTNSGTTTATGVVMRDPKDDADSLTLSTPHTVLPSGLALTQVTTTQGTCAIKDTNGTVLHASSASLTGLTSNNENALVDCALGTIGPGGSVTIVMKATVGTAFLQGGKQRDYVNVASAQAQQGNPLEASGNTAAIKGEDVLLAGRVWEDTNHDRVLNDNETLRSGWIVNILDTRTGQVLATKTTDSDGRYSFTTNDISPGTYSLQFLSANGSTLSRAVSNNFNGSKPGDDTSSPGSIVSITLVDGNNIIEQNLPLDPSGIVYNSLTGNPVAGATVSMSGPPGFDPAIHLAVGQQNQVTGSDGFYRFDINQFAGAPAGIYTISVIPPAAFTFVSTNITPSGTLDVPSSVLIDPFLVVAGNTPNIAGITTYYLSFLFDGNDTNVVNNHIPLDPVSSANTPIIISKTTPKETVVKGDLVPYSITATNVDTTTYTNTAIVDTIPPGFKYVAGTATLDGARSEPTVNGRTLTWSPVNFALSQSHTIEMVLVVGTGVDLGKYVNSVQVNNALGTPISNVATATVLVVEDPIMDCSDIIGTVFADTNGNAYQDLGERGIPGVRVVTVNGLLITTDQYGRYHIACADIPKQDRGSNFILKLDERTLPTGYRLTSENPRVVRTTRGKLVKANFAAALMQVVRLQLDERAFVAGASELLPQWAEQGLKQVVNRLVAEGQLGLLRVVYWSKDNDTDLAERRVDWVIEQLESLWGSEDGRPPLTVEREIRSPEATGETP